MQPHHWKNSYQKDVSMKSLPLDKRPQWNSTENSITWGLSFRETNHQEKTWTWAQMFNPQNETRGNLSCYKGFNDQRFAVTKRKQFK